MTLPVLTMAHRRRLRLGILVLLVVACLMAAFVWKEAFGSSGEHFSEVLASVRIQAARLSAWGLVAAFSVVLFCAFPLGLLTIIAGAVFGPWVGLLLILSGALVSGTMSFIVGRFLGNDTISWQASQKISQLLARFQAKGLLTVIVVRLVPIAPFAVANMALGAAGIRYCHFALGTSIGMLPGAIAILWFADSIVEAIH